jgi:hypothetical protein
MFQARSPVDWGHKPDRSRQSNFKIIPRPRIRERLPALIFAKTPAVLELRK